MMLINGTNILHKYLVIDLLCPSTTLVRDITIKQQIIYIIILCFVYIIYQIFRCKRET